MTVLDKIWWRSTGGGPGGRDAPAQRRLDAIDLAALEARFTVVVVSPRGFGPSEHPGGYSGVRFLADVARVLKHLGVLEYAAFGYSMSPVMAARLAGRQPAGVDRSVRRFPLTADLGAMGELARLRHAAARADAAAWAEGDDDVRRCGGGGVLGRRRLPAAAALVDLACPIRCWWGAEDLVLGSLADPGELAVDLSERGIPYDVLPSLDHDAALDRLDLVLPGETVRRPGRWLLTGPTAVDDRWTNHQHQEDDLVRRLNLLQAPDVNVRSGASAGLRVLRDASPYSSTGASATAYRRRADAIAAGGEGGRAGADELRSLVL